MKRFNIHIALSAVLCFSLMSFVITWTNITREEFEAAMNKTESFYKTNKRYSVKIKYATFRGHESEVPYEESNGYYHRDNNQYQSYLVGVRTIQNEKYKVVIDSVHQSIMVADPENAQATEELMQINFTNSHTYITGYKSSELEKSKIYRVDFNTVPAYSAYTMEMTNEGQLKELTIFYKEEYPLDASNPNSPKAKPKLKITYSDFNNKITFNPAKEFGVDKYFSEINGKLTLKAAYKNYKLADLRIPKKN